MEIIFAWFWLIKLFVSAILVVSIYFAFWKKRGKSTIWNVVTAILLILAVINPVKIKPETDKVNSLQNVKIEQQKVLPEMVSDNSFEKKSNVVGISKEDLK